MRKEDQNLLSVGPSEAKKIIYGKNSGLSWHSSTNALMYDGASSESAKTDEEKSNNKYQLFTDSKPAQKVILLREEKEAEKSCGCCPCFF